LILKIRNTAKAMQYDLRLLMGIAQEAGAFMVGANAQEQRQSTDKTNAKDFVTVADIKSQDLIRARLKSADPQAIVLSEEDDEAARQALYDLHFSGYVIDPIDGTYNFKRDMRESAISIGVIQEGQSVAGVIFDPYKNELYSVEKGKGAWCNGTQIHVSAQETIEGASVATSNSYNDEAMARNLKRHLAIFKNTGHMPWTMCPGSGVLIMAYVACGRFDAYHHNGLKPWDNAAAFLLVREAGGIVHSLAQASDAPFTANAVLIGNPAVYKQLRSVFDAVPASLLC
jgi:myo-inositol-1(or 4)-monophosphatase